MRAAFAARLCLACTFENAPGSDACTICGTSRGSETPAAPAQEARYVGQYRVEYDDGDVRYYHLRQKRVKLLDDADIVEASKMASKM